ncbi:uncharacterized protein LOC100378274 [Saccoglossus kowalevskii]|uniref:Crossover junction endonuclease EME1-like n=1 Tax=Saccoglossus kowalevskii TaxID=10224 RepID=A0ABM0MGG9_SACKO|nr:PREDICTED: crossover junction endonuclease EME1-like [Saccoglossus kowalevskii]
MAHFPSEADVNMVLAVVQGASVSAVRRNLLITGNVESTINNVLDGMLIDEEPDIETVSNPMIVEDTKAEKESTTEEYLSSTDINSDNSDISLPAVDFTTIKTKNILNSHTSLQNSIVRMESPIEISGESNDGVPSPWRDCDHYMSVLENKSKDHFKVKPIRKYGAWSVSSSSSDEDEMLPLSLTHRLQQKLQKKETCGNSQISCLGSQNKVCASIRYQSSCYSKNDSDYKIQDRYDVIKRRAMDDREMCEGSGENEIDINEDTPGAVRKKKRRSPEQIEELKRQALQLKMKKQKEKTEIQRQKVQQMVMKETEKLQKVKEREEKKQEKEREMCRKKAERTAAKAARPEECLKYVTVFLDQRLIEDPGGADILIHLQSKDVKYSLTFQPITNGITWKRQQLQDYSQSSQSSNNPDQTDENEVLVVLQAVEFVEMVHAFKEVNSSHINQKNKQNRDFRTAVLSNQGGDDNGKGGKRKNKSGILRVITRVDMEEALVDLQLNENCNVRLEETMADVGTVIAMFTKAIAEAPFKRERDKGIFSFHVSTEWAGGVRVDKDGKGLLRVWRQQLQQFRLVSVDKAAAIVAAYPSPQILMKAYQECSSAKQAEKLLQDIVVRRGAGVLATNRRIGPELSRKVYLFLTSHDGDMVLHSRH